MSEEVELGGGKVWGGDLAGFTFVRGGRVGLGMWYGFGG